MNGIIEGPCTLCGGPLHTANAHEAARIMRSESKARQGHGLDDEYDDGVDGLSEPTDEAEPDRPTKLQDEARWTWGWRP
jgi:hypothetical protein